MKKCYLVIGALLIVALWIDLYRIHNTPENTHSMEQESLNDPMKEFEELVERMLPDTYINWSEAISEDGYNTFGMVSEEHYSINFSISSTDDTEAADKMWNDNDYPSKVEAAGGRSFFSDKTVLIEETGEETISIKYIARTSDKDMFYVTATVVPKYVAEVYDYINKLTVYYGTPSVNI